MCCGGNNDGDAAPNIVEQEEVIKQLALLCPARSTPEASLNTLRLVSLAWQGGGGNLGGDDKWARKARKKAKKRDADPQEWYDIVMAVPEDDRKAKFKELKQAESSGSGSGSD